MKKKNLALLLSLLGTGALAGGMTACGGGGESGPKASAIQLEGDMQAMYEYSEKEITFPSAIAVDKNGNTVAYEILYTVLDKETGEEVASDQYSSFHLDVGSYTLVYSYGKVKESVDFSVVDTTAPELVFTDVPSGLFYEEGMPAQMLPGFQMSDISDIANVEQSLTFTEAGGEPQEHEFNDFTMSYEVPGDGVFTYSVTVTDEWGNSTTETASWKVKDLNWTPSNALADGVLSDFSEAGYANHVKDADIGEYYAIPNNYSEEWLEEFEGANGVMKIDMGYNQHVARSSIAFTLAKSFTEDELEGKYLAIRAYIEGEGLSSIAFAGNHKLANSSGNTEAKWASSESALETGVWKTYYIKASLVKDILCYSGEISKTMDGSGNESATYVSQGAMNTLQIALFGENKSSRITMYVDNISIATILGNTEVSIEGNKAVWTPVDGASGYRVDMNGTVAETTDTEMELVGESGYVKVSVLGNGSTVIDGGTATGVYGITPAEGTAMSFDSELYHYLFNADLGALHDSYGYVPKWYTPSYNGTDYVVEVGPGQWGIVSGIRMQFPTPIDVTKNKAVDITLKIADTTYTTLRIFDYSNGIRLDMRDITTAMGEDWVTIQLDLSEYAYDKLVGLEFVFGTGGDPSAMHTVMTFKSVVAKEKYEPNPNITLDKIHYTQSDLMQIPLSLYGFEQSYELLADATLDATYNGNAYTPSMLVYHKSAEILEIRTANKTPKAGDIFTLKAGSIIKQGDYSYVLTTDFHAAFDAETNGWVVSATGWEGEPEEIDRTITITTVGYTTNTVIQTTKELAGFTEAELDKSGITATMNGEVYTPSLVKYWASGVLQIETIGHDPAEGDVLTIKKDSTLTQGDITYTFAADFNVKMEGGKWVYSETGYVAPENPDDGGDETPDENTITITSVGYTSNTVIQTNITLEGFVDNQAMDKSGITATMNGEAYTISDLIYHGSGVLQFQTLGYVPVDGDILTIKAGSTISQTNDGSTYTYTLGADFNVKFEGETATGKWVYSETGYVAPENPDDGDETPDENTITITSVGYTSNTVIQTNITLEGFVDNQAMDKSGIAATMNGEAYTISDLIYHGSGVLQFQTLGYVPVDGDILTIKAGSTISQTNDGSTYTYTLGADFNVKFEGETATGKWVYSETGYVAPSYIDLLDHASVNTYGTQIHVCLNNSIFDQTNAGVTFAGTVTLDGEETSIGMHYHGDAKNSLQINMPTATAGQKFIIAAGSTLTQGDITYVVEKDFVLVYDGSAWAVYYGINLNDNASVNTYGTQIHVCLNNSIFDQTNAGVTFAGTVTLDGEETSISMHYHGDAKNSLQINMPTATAGQVFKIAAGSTLTQGNITYTVESDFVLTYDGSAWAKA